MMPAANLILSPIVNFAMQQNHVPVVRSLVIENNSEEDWQNIQASISIEPQIATGWTQQIDSLPKSGKWEASNIWLNLSAKYLAELTERVASSLTLSITANSQTVFQQHYPIDILAYDQWNGAAVLPEMLAAFVTPNHPDIVAIIRRASAILEGWTGNPSFDEYQSRNPDRVRKQMAAMYEAIAELEIIYCAAPASFEETGQRIRLADALLTQKLGNCLDLSLLYAACLEAVRLRPLVVIVKGHAFAGAWLIEESFADAVNDDPSLLTKRMAEGINEIALVEATCMNAGSHAAFGEAEKSAAKHLADTKQFYLFLDVQRARYGGIRPLPLRIATATGWEIIAEKGKERSTAAPLELAPTMAVSFGGKTPVSKQQLWERKLLDLTLRNNLLNLRITKSTLQFITISPAKLEDALANGDEFQVLPKPADWDNPLRQAGLYQAIYASDPIADLVNHELGQRRLRTYLPQAELDAGITALYRSSRLALEENGANTLYIALGFLKWFETAASERPLYAPILLVPVEIVRKSVQRGYVIRSREEETMINITLLEKLRQDFGISISSLDTLPRDESGVDVKAVFNMLRHGIMGQSRWDVEEQALLGTFSFSKFILWNDIHNNSDELRQNKIVASLISGKLEWQPEEEAEIANPDAALKPADLALPISTDSSQLEAIIAAGRGKSFVLHGPPGTGKSQTITNIIANALYAGKKVLFVAAKKAALDVVESRLDSIGLAPFCLELHSNKAKKSAVLEQLRSATEVAKKAAPEGFAAESERLYNLRNELNGYVQALHQKHSFGFSLYDAISHYSRLQPPVGTAGQNGVYEPQRAVQPEQKPERNNLGSSGQEMAESVQFNTATIALLTKNKLVEWNDIVEEMAATGKLIGSPYQHPLQGIYLKQYTQATKDDAITLLKEYTALLPQLEAITQKVAAILQITQPILTREQTAMLATLAEAVLRLPDTPPSMLRVDALEQTLAQVKEMTAHGKRRNAIRENLLQQFTSAILSINAEGALARWNAASAKWLLPRWLGQKKEVKALLPLAKTGAIHKEELPAQLQAVIDYQQAQMLIDKATYLPQMAGYLWKGGEPDWDQLAAVSNELILLNRVAAAIVGPVGTRAWRTALAQEMGEGSGLYFSAHATVLEKLGSLNRRATQLETEWQKLLGVEKTEIVSGNWIAVAAAQANCWLQNIDSLKNWTAWMAVKQKALTAGLQSLVTAYESGNVSTHDLTLQYQKGLYRSSADFIIGQSPQLSGFSGQLFEERIRKFKSLSRQFEQLTKDELYARLAANIPSFTQEAAQSSEIGILQKNLRNNGRATSIRRLFDSIPNLLPRLTPCMLMSPISVAQYFDAGKTHFDIVIFDEASQMPTCEAVGAIARGASLVVVGDPKQMPPTSFFTTNNVDEENIEQEDLESILDDCLALSMPSKYLLWHYRSKHESLIAFSNARYYDNQLFTFPSTDDITSKVTAVQVPGYYDKGKTRQNIFEAKAIVAEVVRRLNDPALQQRSIGIVTFSSVQQNLVEDLLNEEFAKAPHLEKIALESAEPIFIKNLENVQGDERDVILFSICYGPDEAGKVSLNFGPVNRTGGQRRLNVAVSRARYEMKVFATLQSDQIDLARSSSEGVAGLKAFLAYAEKGKAALPAKIIRQDSSDASLENVMAAAIRQQGYEVHTSIGTSAYKIDMGIINPENKSQYLLGIVCDGKAYSAAKTARDREMVQPDVLQALGWTIHKVWSAEWWEDEEKVLEGIVAAIEKARHSKPEPVAEKAPEPFLPVKEVFNKAAPAVQALTEQPGMPYQLHLLLSVKNATAGSFLLPDNRPVVLRQMKDVLQMESPISKDLLYSRVLAAWGAPRIGSRISAYLDTLLTQMHYLQTTHGSQAILWKITSEPQQYTGYRTAAANGPKRDAEDLPPEEIANAVQTVLKQQISLPTTDLVREVAKVFGFVRMGSNVETAIGKGIALAVEKELAAMGNGRVMMKG